MSYVEVARNQIESELHTGLNILDWIDGNAPRCIRIAVAAARAQRPLIAIPDALAEALIAQVRSSTAETRKALLWAKGVVATAGSPDSLRKAAVAIRNEVVAPVEPLADSVTLSHLPSALETNWKDGGASESYQNAVDGRSAAVERIGAYAANMADALDELADAIESFYLALLQLVISLVAALAGAAEVILTLAGVVTAPAAILGVIAAIAGVLSLVVSGYQLAVTSEQDARSVTTALGQRIDPWADARV